MSLRLPALLVPLAACSANAQTDPFPANDPRVTALQDTVTALQDTVDTLAQDLEALQGTVATLREDLDAAEARATDLTDALDARGDLYAATISLSSAGCSVLATQGDWITSTNRAGPGDCTLGFAASTFLAAPTCVASTSGAARRWVLNTTTSTSVDVEVWNEEGVGTQVDTNFSIACFSR